MAITPNNNNKPKNSFVYPPQLPPGGNNFSFPLRPGGNILDQNIIGSTQITNQTFVKQIEPKGTKIPKLIKERASGYSELSNLSHDFSFQKVQSALRSAERGDMARLFAFYRDFILSSGMTSSELSKRKLSTISEPWTILPVGKKPEDIEAAEVITECLNKCSEFSQALSHLMNAVIYPVAVLEKIYEPIDESTYGANKYNLLYKIKKLYPVDYQLITYRLPYLPQGPINLGGVAFDTRNTEIPQDLYNKAMDTIWDPDFWEPNLRFWSVFENGLINYSYASMMSPDIERHIIYRCNMLNGIARENWGGLGRAVLWWTIMAQMGVDKFLQCLQKYGVPFILAKVDTSDQTTINQIYEAFSNANIVNAMAVNKDAIVELEQMNMTDASTAHEKFTQFCHDQISLLINGQTLGSHAKSTGLGSGVASIQSDVREDFIKYDRLSLAEVLQTSLFRPYLDINGKTGNTPKIVWGSSNTTDESVKLSTAIYNLYQSGISLAPESIESLSVKFGFKLILNAQDNNKLNKTSDKIIDTEEIKKEEK